MRHISQCPVCGGHWVSGREHDSNLVFKIFQSCKEWSPCAFGSTKEGKPFWGHSLCPESCPGRDLGKSREWGGKEPSLEGPANLEAQRKQGPLWGNAGRVWPCRPWVEHWVWATTCSVLENQALAEGSSHYWEMQNTSYLERAPTQPYFLSSEISSCVNISILDRQWQVPAFCHTPSTIYSVRNFVTGTFGNRRASTK